MSKYYIFIQRTNAGLDQEFSSQGFDPVNDPEIKGTISDERAYSTQLASNSNVYSLQITENYRIYSLIVTDVVDSFNRPGFYEIKLYGPSNIVIEGFVEILNQINVRYLTTGEKSTQDFSEILSGIVVSDGEAREKYSHVSKISKDFYFYFETTKDLSILTQDKNIFLINKVYGLQKDKASPKNVAEALGLEALDDENHREVLIRNPDKVLNAIYVNDKKLGFYPNSPELTLLLLKTDQVAFTTVDDKDKKVILEDEISVKRKFIAQTRPNYPKSKNGGKRGTFQSNFIYILLLLVMGGAGYFGYSTFFQNTKTNNSTGNQQYTSNPHENKPDFNFVKVDNRYASRELDTIVFVLKNDIWYFGIVEKAILPKSKTTEIGKGIGGINQDTNDFMNGRESKSEDSVAVPAKTNQIYPDVFKSFKLSKAQKKGLLKDLGLASNQAIEFQIRTVDTIKSTTEKSKPPHREDRKIINTTKDKSSKLQASEADKSEMFESIGKIDSTRN